MIDFVIVDERLRKNVLDTRVYRGTAIHTDHFLVMSRISGLFRRWRHRNCKTKNVLERIKVERLQEEEVRVEYESKLIDRFKGSEEVNDLEDLWEAFKNGVVSVASDVCGTIKRRKGNKVKNTSWDENVQKVTCQKKKAWLDWLATRANERVCTATNEDTEKAWENYKRMKGVVKKVVNEKKKENKNEFDRRLSKDFQNNIKFFWKSIRSVRGKTLTSELSTIRDQNGSVINEENRMLELWKKYFESLYEKDSGVSEETAVLDTKEDKWNDCISIYEVMKAMNTMKPGKSAGYDKITSEMLKAGQGAIVSQLCRLFNMCYNTGRVPSDWCKAVIVPLYKGKGSRQDCKSYRGISLLSVVGKLYAKVLIERVVKETDGKIWDAQAGFRKGMGCSDQVFSLRTVVEKFLAKSQRIYCAFIDLEKAYDRVVRNVLWSVLSVYGLDDILIRALKSLYSDSRACVRINGSCTDWFNIEKGVRQGCVASPWLFNLYMDMCLQDLKESMYGLRMNELLVKCFLYADDQVILASSAEELQEMVTLVNEAFERKGLKVNVRKTKVMVFEKDECLTPCKIMIGGEIVEQVKEFVYLGTLFNRDGKHEKDIERRMNAGNLVNGALHAYMCSRNIDKKARRAVHDGVLVPTLMYGSESWVWQKKDESKINAVEMRGLRSMCGVTLNDRVRNVVVRERCGIKEDVITKIEKGMLRWFGHVERMDERRLTKKVYLASVSGTVGRGRPRRTYSDQIEDILERGQVRSTLNRRACMKNVMRVNEAKEVCKDRDKWKSVVSAYPYGKQA